MQEVENGSFNPLVFSLKVCVGREFTRFYKRLLELISEKRKQRYNTKASFVKQKVSFSIINSICLCVRGSRSGFCNLAELISYDVEASKVTSNILV